MAPPHGRSELGEDGIGLIHGAEDLPEGPRILPASVLQTVRTGRSTQYAGAKTAGGLCNGRGGA